MPAPNYIYTCSGKKFSLVDPQPEDVALADIAHALSHICRYTGHTNEFYSVAEHSVLVSQKCEPEWAREGLMHDAAEAYIGDIATPVKALLGDPVRELERRIMAAISERFGLKAEGLDVVHRGADLNVFQDEVRDLFPSLPNWGVSGVPTGAEVKFPKKPWRARFEFHQRAEELDVK